ncbi:SDR family NAD(P)-dependent oxidoreductase [Pseudooceanicola nanhaiensis]|uniref:SDR family NAD(P)-dependent oxidoreductase n=1 Tax=Pseudooceanicola nanhaiensis TaxID=375761 RepID=UPI001CD64B9F|nr:SDR family NAD(P)-dependent oxidoreductase [Pseudooceanicola nanhaiensis]MCA0922673.1 SDR family NAD(P)-dependent oxidoreductase [Pseudooceanicola nanhaiensis]
MLEGKTAIVTGAGRGIGRDIALMMASRGAAVVVNDLGGSGAGEGADQTPAQQVVDEIVAAGGKAVANFGNVARAEDAKAMYEQAMDTFDGIDIVVNNAGILRDMIFHKMTEEAWDSVIAVHLKGSFNMAQAVAAQFKMQASGCFLNFTSTSGLIGNFGQANYSAAKMGIVGLSKSLALDMARFNVRSNCIAPFAWSRLIGTIPANTEAEKARVERIKEMTPAKIAPLCVALADPTCETSGQIFCIRNNEIFLMSQPRPIRSIHRSEGWSPETVRDHALPAMKADFYPLDRSGDIFSWDPV